MSHIRAPPFYSPFHTISSLSINHRLFLSLTQHRTISFFFGQKLEHHTYQDISLPLHPYSLKHTPYHLCSRSSSLPNHTYFLDVSCFIAQFHNHHSCCLIRSLCYMTSWSNDIKPKISANVISFRNHHERITPSPHRISLPS